MGRPPIPLQEINRVKLLWAEKGKPNAKKLRGDDRKKYSERKYQQWITEAKQAEKEMPADPELVPWGDCWPENNPDAIECLYRLRYKALRHHTPLTTRVGKWAMRFRKLFTGPSEASEVDLDVQLLHWAHAYAMRERACESLGVPMHFADLDGFLMFRPWESPEKGAEYNEAVTAGLVPSWSVETIIRDEADAIGSEELVIGFVRILVKAMEELMVDDLMEGGLNPEKSAYWSIEAKDQVENLHHLLTHDPEAVSIIEKQLGVITENFEAAVDRAKSPGKREVFELKLSWWQDFIPILKEWILSGKPPLAESESETEEIADARTSKETIQG